LEIIMGKGGGGPKPAKPAVQVSYRKEKAREEVRGGTSRRTLGSQYRQKPTLG